MGELSFIDLNLTIKRGWFELIGQGYKLEEYREIKPYWTKRLMKNDEFRKFDRVCFRNGYSWDSPWIAMQFKGIYIKKLTEQDECPEEWIGKQVYAIKLGEIMHQAYWEPETIWAAINIEMKQL